MRTFIISGLAGGIGQLLARSFDRDGNKVIGLIRKTEAAFKPNGGCHCVNIADWLETSNFVESRKAELENIIVLACAGVSYTAFAHKTDHDKWEATIKTNLIGAFNLAAACLPEMRRQKYGRIIFFSSVIAQTPTPGVSAYAASKAGLWGLSKSLAAENASMGITVNCLNLGYMEMGMINEVPAAFLNKILERIPAGRFGDADSIVRSVEYLIESSYINGASIDLNGAMI